MPRTSFTASVYDCRDDTSNSFGSSNQEDIAEIAKGQLYFVCPQSPEGHSKLNLQDAAAYIRKPGQDFQYQPIIQQANKGGEEEP